MSLPKTINYCQEHDNPYCSCGPVSASDLTRVHCRKSHYTASYPHPCRMVELRVAGPDDLLIRREDIDYEAAKRAAFEMAEQIAQARYEGQRFSLTEVNDLKVRAAVDAALAAAEGEEHA